MTTPNSAIRRVRKDLNYGPVDMSPEGLKRARLDRHLQRTGTSDPRDFGTWRLLSTSQSLVLKREDWRVVHLGQCGSSAAILDGIFHNLSKDLTNQELADMIYAIDAILHPCRNYCSSGNGKQASGRQLVKAYLESFKA